MQLFCVINRKIIIGIYRQGESIMEVVCHLIQDKDLHLSLASIGFLSLAKQLGEVVRDARQRPQAWGMHPPACPALLLRPTLNDPFGVSHLR